MQKHIDQNTLIESLTRRYEHIPEERRNKIICDISLLHDEVKNLVADPTFNKALLNGDKAAFQQRYWEMLLAHHLMQIGVRVSHESSGPDFGFALDGRRIWIEAVAPDRSQDIDNLYKLEAENRSAWFKADIFYLRWTQAIIEKINKFTIYINQGRIRAGDICIIAVNSGILGSLGMTGKSTYPILIDVVFGVGAEYVTIDQYSSVVIDQGYRIEPTVAKTNRSTVPKNIFMDKKSSYISAILACGSTPEIWTPFIIAYNPLADNPLARGRIGADWEYYAENCGEHLEIKTGRAVSLRREIK